MTAWASALGALNAALAAPGVDPFDASTGATYAKALATAGAAFDQKTLTTSASIPAPKIYTGFAPDGSPIVSLTELGTPPVQVTPAEIYKAARYLLTLCNVSLPLFAGAMPPCPNLLIPVFSGPDLTPSYVIGDVDADPPRPPLPDTSFALGWVQIGTAAYLAVTNPPAAAVSFFGTVGDLNLVGVLERGDGKGVV